MLRLLTIIFCLLWLGSSQAFSPSHVPSKKSSSPFLSRPTWVLAAESPEETPSTNEESKASPATESPPDTKLSLEEKMKAWEATEEEIRASTLGGVVPGGGERSDAFDVGLYIAFPIMVLSGLAFAFFPFIMGNLDVDSVGPPPTL